jgi:hypothetical protein
MEKTGAMARDAGSTEGSSEGPERTVARWRRVALSERDWEILSWAHEQKFLLYDQVAGWFPGGQPNPKVQRKARTTRATERRRERPGNWYIQERLRKLVRFDVLRRKPVFTDSASALLPGKVGCELLEGTGRDRELARLDGIDWKNFEHDRAVTDVRWQLAPPPSFAERAGVEARASEWKSERVLRREFSSRHVPDALLKINGLNVALEVELTRKSTARYMSVLRWYLTWPGPRFDRVLYVLADRAALEHMFKVMLPTVLRQPELGVARQSDLRLFQFTTRVGLVAGKVWNAPDGTEGVL